MVDGRAARLDDADALDGESARDGGEARDGEDAGLGLAPPPRRRRRALRLAAAVVAAAVVALVIARALTPATVAVVAVTRGTAVDAVYASGTVEAIDRVEIRARIAGALEAILVHEGERVARGQLLGRIEAPTLQLEIERGRAELEAARARSLPSLAALRAQERMTAAQLDDARAEVDGDQRIAHAGGVAARDLERARLRVATLEQQLAMVQAQLRETEVTRQVEVVRSSKDYAGAEVRSRDAQVRSPIAGDVLRVIVDPGRLVQPNEAILRIGDARRLHLEALVDEEDVARLRLDSACLVRVSAFGDRVLHGHVSHIAPEADREHHSFRIFVTLDDGTERLRPGMSAEIDVIAARRERSLLVPRQAVRDGHVWRLEADERLHRRAVKTGVGDLDRIEVLDGLAEGDRVVAAPDADLGDGVRARAEAAPAAPAATVARAER
jgi:RND family efflux transporter MFP subunit